MPAANPDYSTNPVGLWMVALGRLDVSAGADSCWSWLAGVNRYGYGHIGSSGKLILIHRLAVVADGRTIPPGMVVDHRCHNEADCSLGNACPHRRCANPAHLDVVTNAENCRRSPNIGNDGLAAALREGSNSCLKGHPIHSVADTYVRRDGGQVECRACRREAMTAFRESNRDRINAAARRRRALARVA